MPTYLEFEKPLLDIQRKIDELRQISMRENLDLSEEIKRLEKKSKKLQLKIFSNLTPYQRTLISRHPLRPYTLDYIPLLFQDFIELHGDRNFSDDPSILCGIANFKGKGVVVIGHQKGRTTKEKIRRNFGMPMPEGYRKSLRIMSLAERHRKPIITFIDTPGAYPGIGAEERGQAEAIAKNIMVMAKLKVPIISIVIGEGGSGGALAIGVANRILMLENAIYSVISPEGCAAILWKDHNMAEAAASALKLTAEDCLRLGIVDEVIKEPLGGIHNDIKKGSEAIAKSLKKWLDILCQMSSEEIIEDRYNKYRKIGIFEK